MYVAKRPLPSETRFELTYSGAPGLVENRYFTAEEFNDALTRSALKITEFDKNPNVIEAYVTLSRLPDSMSATGRGVLAWTKTSGIRPSVEGARSLEK